MFPLVAGTGEKERKDLRVIATSLLLVIVTGSLFAIGLSFTPAWVWTKCLGAGFKISGAYDLSYLATLYAIKSVIYSISVVFITFEMAYKIANSNAVQLAFSVILVAGVYEFHSSLLEVILVQLVLLSVLVVFSAVPLLIDLRSDRNEPDVTEHLEPIRLIRKVSEDEVISEFLKSDFRDAEFRECPVQWREIIVRPNFADAKENQKRRAMHLLRHLSLWNEIPRDTEWYEVEINELPWNKSGSSRGPSGESSHAATSRLPELPTIYAPGGISWMPILYRRSRHSKSNYARETGDSAR